MIPRDALINALRSLNYTHKKQADRVDIWKQRGSTKRVEVRRHDLHDETYAKILLKQAGMTDEDIIEFIRTTSTGRN